MSVPWRRGAIDCSGYDRLHESVTAPTILRDRVGTGEGKRASILIRPPDRIRGLTFAIRTLFHTALVTAIAIISLALGIGGTAGIVSVFHQVLLRTLAVPQVSEFVSLRAPRLEPGFGSSGPRERLRGRLSDACSATSRRSKPS